MSLSPEECCVKINPPGSLSLGESHDADSPHRGRPPKMKFTLIPYDHEGSPCKNLSRSDRAKWAHANLLQDFWKGLQSWATDCSLCTESFKALFKDPSYRTSPLSQIFHRDDYAVIDAALVCETLVWKIFINHLLMTRPKYRQIGYDGIYQELNDLSVYLKTSLPWLSWKSLPLEAFPWTEDANSRRSP